MSNKNLGRCLLLNADYQPMKVISVERAICMLLADDVVALESDSNAPIRSKSISIDRPLVVLAKKYKKAKRANFINPTRRRVLMRDKFACVYCGDKANTIDHVVPKSKGGGNSWTNMASACKPCNCLKSDKTLEEMNWRIKKPLRAPTHAELMAPQVPEEIAETYLGV